MFRLCGVALGTLGTVQWAGTLVCSKHWALDGRPHTSTHGVATSLLVQYTNQSVKSVH